MIDRDVIIFCGRSLLEWDVEDEKFRGIVKKVFDKGAPYPPTVQASDVIFLLMKKVKQQAWLIAEIRTRCRGYGEGVDLDILEMIEKAKL